MFYKPPPRKQTKKTNLVGFCAGRFAGEQIRVLKISLVLTDNPLLTSFSRENVEDVAR